MRKLFTIATIIFTMSCSTNPAGGPPIFSEDEIEKPVISMSDFVEEAKMVSYTYQMGPFSIDSGEKGALSEPFTMNFNVEEPFWMTSFEPVIEDSEGNSLSGEIIHQIILVNHAEVNNLCTTKQTGNPFAATTSSMDPIEMPEGCGYPLLPTDPLEARIIFKKAPLHDLKNVVVKFRIEGEPVQDTILIKDVFPMMIDVDPCDHKPISLAPGQFVEKKLSATMPEDGNIIQAHGLLQDFGVSLTLGKDGSADPFWEGIASIDEAYHIVTLAPYADMTGVSVTGGERINLTVTYNNVSDEWFDTATAAAIIYLARTDSAKEIEGMSATSQTEQDATNVQMTLLSK